MRKKENLPSFVHPAYIWRTGSEWSKKGIIEALDVARGRDFSNAAKKFPLKVLREVCLEGAYNYVPLRQVREDISFESAYTLDMFTRELTAALLKG